MSVGMSVGMDVGIDVGMDVGIEEGIEEGTALALTAALPRPIVSVVDPQPARQYAAASPARRRKRANGGACMA
jgi:hypothetical protein